MFFAVRKMTHSMPAEVYHSDANKKPCTSMGVSLINANKPKFIMKDKITAQKSGGESRWRGREKKGRLAVARSQETPSLRPSPLTLSLSSPASLPPAGSARRPPRLALLPVTNPRCRTDAIARLFCNYKRRRRGFLQVREQRRDAMLG